MIFLESEHTQIFDKRDDNMIDQLVEWLLEKDNYVFASAGVMSVLLFDGSQFAEISSDSLGAYVDAYDAINHTKSQLDTKPLKVRELFNLSEKKVFSITINPEMLDHSSMIKVLRSLFDQMSRKSADDSGTARVVLEFTGPLSQSILQRVRVYILRAAESFSSEILNEICLALEVSNTTQSLAEINSLSGKFIRCLSEAKINVGVFTSIATAEKWLLEE